MLGWLFRSVILLLVAHKYLFGLDAVRLIIRSRIKVCKRATRVRETCEKNVMQIYSLANINAHERRAF